VRDGIGMWRSNSREEPRRVQADSSDQADLASLKRGEEE